VFVSIGFCCAVVQPTSSVFFLFIQPTPCNNSSSERRGVLDKARQGKARQDKARQGSSRRRRKARRANRKFFGDCQQKEQSYTRYSWRLAACSLACMEEGRGNCAIKTLVGPTDRPTDQAGMSRPDSSRSSIQQQERRMELRAKENLCETAGLVGR
jgi:hypothetical protein